MTIWLAGGGVQGRPHDRRDRRDRAPRPSSASTTSATCTSRCCACSGLDDNKLTYFHGGRFKQLSQFGGQVIKELIA